MPVVVLGNDRLLGEIVATGIVIPDPVNVTVCGLPEALSTKVRVPFLVPDAVGVKVTLMVQDDDAANVAPQVVVLEKSPAVVIEVILRVAFPVFWRLTDCEAELVPTVWLANVKLLGEIVAMGAVGAVPVPDKGMLCGLPEALSTKVRVPERAPVAVGVKLTLIVQDADAANVAPQVDDMEKSPLGVIDVMLSVAFPVFCRVTGCEELVVPTVVLPNVKLLGLIVAIGAAGAVPVPVKETVWGLPEALSVNDSVPDLAPVAVGVNVTVTVQVAFAAKVAPQVVVRAKSPVAVIEVIFKVVLPVF